MAIYDVDGNEIFTPFDIDGIEQNYAYGVDGSVVYQNEPQTLKVMSFNVGCFYTQYFPCPDDKSVEFYQRHRTIFNAHKPDLCGIPEWNNTIGVYSSALLMNEFWNDTYSAYVYNVQTAGLTFASKYQLNNISLVQYAQQDSNTRYYEKAYINVGGKQICFVNTHLGISDVRNAQFIELLNMLENEEYFIATGDFNFRIESIGDSEYNLSVQLALNRGFNSAQNANGIFMTGYHGETAETSTSITALDNILTSSNLPISNVAVDTTKLTDGLCVENDIIIDHLPIVCDVTIN